MHRYVIKRLLMLIPVLLCVAFVIYAIMDVAEGDPVYSVVSADASEEEIEAAREELGLNGTLIERYFRDSHLQHLPEDGNAERCSPWPHLERLGRK